jgi:hypothetical protein
VTSSHEANIYRVKLGASVPPEPVSELNTLGDEERPVLTPDALTIYWSGHPLGSDEWRVWRAHRASLSSAFTDVRAMDTPSIPPPDSLDVIGISGDECRLYVIQSPVGAGLYDRIAVLTH